MNQVWCLSRSVDSSATSYDGESRVRGDSGKSSVEVLFKVISSLTSKERDRVSSCLWKSRAPEKVRTVDTGL